MYAISNTKMWAYPLKMTKGLIIYANHEWFLKLYFDKEEIKYNENGIETSLYRLREYESYLDWYAINNPSPLGRFIPDDDDE